MDNYIDVSVIIPIYNAEKYLEESLRGVINQTLRNTEIICVDDGSTDSSPDILMKLANEDKRIRIVTQEKSDAGAARNRGLKEAKGKYLSFLDADDIFEPQMLEEAYLKAEEGKAEIVVFRSDRYNCSVGRYEDAGWTIREECIPQKDVFAAYEVRDLFNAFSGWAWDKLYLHEYITERNLHFQEQRYINDRFFVETAFAGADRICVLNKLLVHKRINAPGALTTGYFEGNNWKYWLSAVREIFDWLNKEGTYRDNVKNFVSFAARNILWNLDGFVECESFDQLFEYVKNDYLPQLEILKMGAKCFYDNEDYKCIQDISNSTAESFRWNRMLGRKDGSYLFPFELVPKGSKIILYGAGKVGREYYRQIMFSDWCEIVAWVDKTHERIDYISDPESAVAEYVYESIVIAVRDEKIAKEILSTLEKMHICKERIIWRSPEIQINKTKG